MNTHRSAALSAACLAASLGLGACGDDATTTRAATASPATSAAPVIDPGDGGDYQPSLTPADAVERIDNPYFPLLPGSRWVYEGESEGELERIEVEVLHERRSVMGIDAVVVRDRAFTDGELAEDTLDFFTQDTEGNVWYLGEETAEYEGGEITTTAGSWEAGVEGALPGIVMPAVPAIGDAYRQEFLIGEAEDMGEVIAVDGTIDVAAGSFGRVITTRDWTPLDPTVVEEKRYAPGVGLVGETKVEGGQGRVELVEFTQGA